MRRIFKVSVIIAVLVTAVSAEAWQTGMVEIDFPGAAAVEAGMSDPKPVEPDPQGRRRASIVVPLNDRGTVYAMKRADRTARIEMRPI